MREPGPIDIARDYIGVSSGVACPEFRRRRGCDVGEFTSRRPVPLNRSTLSKIFSSQSPENSEESSDKTYAIEREVYVAPFPSGEGERRISTAGGEQPRWRRNDGKELFYIAPDGKMMSVSIKTSEGAKPSLERGNPESLFDSRIAIAVDTRALQYDVTPDGKRFLVNTSASTPASSVSIPPLTVVVNWLQK